MAEIESMTPRTSQWREGEEIPEKHWMYYLAKKFFFNNFGVYRGLEKKRGVGEGGWLTPRIRRRRAGSVDDTTDAIRAVACIRFVRL
jgi:hypothetical protein